MRRGWRRLLGRRRRIDCIYSRHYQLDLSGTALDPQRAERILTFLIAEGLLERRDVRPPEPVSFHELLRVHDGAYLEALLRPGALTSIVGLDVADQTQEKFLRLQRAMVAGTLLATRCARESGGVAVNLGGGLHHAFAGRGERFCLFNDVAVAVAAERDRGFAEPILVVDLDLHDADGTRSMLAGDPAAHVFSIHNRAAPGTETATSTGIELGSDVEDAVYLEAIRTHLPPLVERFEPELVFYLAGADPAADDEIGDWKITPAGMLERDRFVVDLIRGGRRAEGRPPLVVLLAGGYGQDSWRYSARFLAWLLSGEVREPPTTEEVTLLRYRRLAQLFDPAELSGEEPAQDDWGLSEEDVAAALGGVRRPSRLLGFYSLQGLELALERAGILDRLRSRGFSRPTLELELDNPAGDTVRLYGDERRRELLAEVRVRIDRRTLPGFTFLRVEWLLLQDPRGRFTPERPRLPGQRFPGLGMLGDAMALMVLACERLQLDGILFVPSHYHLAGQGRKLMRFVDPTHEGRFRAVQAVLAGLPLPAAAAAVAGGRVVDVRTGEPFAWTPMPMVMPVSERLRERLRGDEYEQQVAAAAAEHRLRLEPEPLAGRPPTASP